MLVDTKGKKFYENQVQCLISGDSNRIVEENYLPNATVQSYDWKVSGHKQLKLHFSKYMSKVAIEEVLSTDHFVETDNVIWFEATIKSSLGVLKVYDVMTLKDGKIINHFAGTR